MLQKDQHLTTEQISAFLDQQLSIQEQASCHVHLENCNDCQRELAGLRQTVALLRALPPVELPRSFTLPTDGPIVSPVLINSDLRQHVGRRRAVLVAIRSVSALAAVIGLFFLVATLVPMVSSSHYSLVATSGNAAFSQEKDTATSDNAASPQSAPVTPDVKQSGQVTAIPPQQPYGANDANNAPPESPASSTFHLPVVFDLTTVQGRLSIGLLLILCGAVGFIIARKRDKTYHGLE